MTDFIWHWNVFFAVVLALLAITLVLLGILTAYFGSGKSRAVGAVLLIVGLVIGLITIFTKSYIGLSNGILESVVVPTFFYVIASVVGMAIGLLVFLGAIMKT